jgi:hypothetical protein
MTGPASLLVVDYWDLHRVEIGAGAGGVGTLLIAAPSAGRFPPGKLGHGLGIRIEEASGDPPDHSPVRGAFSPTTTRGLH